MNDWIYCPNCCEQMPEGAVYCANCGARLDELPDDSSDALYGGVTAGYSRRIDSESVRAALKKQARVTGIVGVVLVLLPLIGFLIYGALSDKMDMGQAVAYGGIISLLFAFAALYTTLKKKLSKPFEGTVTELKKIRRIRTSRRSGYTSRTKYLAYLDCTDGKRRKKEISSFQYEYLREGDRVRYLPQFPQPFEKYDKSRDGGVMCLFCGRINPYENDTCAFCRNPMVK